MKDIMAFLARHLRSNDQSSQTLQKMVQKGELMEVKMQDGKIIEVEQKENSK